MLFFEFFRSSPENQVAVQPDGQGVRMHEIQTGLVLGQTTVGDSRIVKREVPSPQFIEDVYTI